MTFWVAGQVIDRIKERILTEEDLRELVTPVQYRMNSRCPLNKTGKCAPSTLGLLWQGLELGYHQCIEAAYRFSLRQRMSSKCTGRVLPLWLSFRIDYSPGVGLGYASENFHQVWDAATVSILMTCCLLPFPCLTKMVPVSVLTSPSRRLANSETLVELSGSITSMALFRQPRTFLGEHSESKACTSFVLSSFLAQRL